MSACVDGRDELQIYLFTPLKTYASGFLTVLGINFATKKVDMTWSRGTSN